MDLSGSKQFTMLLLVTYFFAHSTTTQNDSCSYVAIATNEENCFAEYNLTDEFEDGLPVPIMLSYSKDKFGRVCTHRENITACIKHAMGSCHHTYFDYEAYRMILLTICSNQHVLKIAETNCDLSSLGICLQYYHTTVIDLMTQVYRRGTQPLISDMCIVFKNTRDCIQIDESETCQGVHSRFLTSLYRRRFMPATCNFQRESCGLSMIPSVTLLVLPIVSTLKIADNIVGSL